MNENGDGKGQALTQSVNRKGRLMSKCQPNLGENVNTKRNETFRKTSENRAKIQESFSETVLVLLPNLLSPNELVKVKLKTNGTRIMVKYYVK